MKNKKNIIIIGIVAMLFIFLYNMAFASDGSSQESTGIWGWLSCSGNSAAVQAIGSIAQAIAAIITFFLMWCLGKNQNKMSQQQITASVFDKRYRFCMKMLDQINEAITAEPVYNPESLQGNCIELTEYSRPARKNLNCLKQSMEKLAFYFSGADLDELKKLLDEAVQHSDKLIKIHLQHMTEVYRCHGACPDEVNRNCEIEEAKESIQNVRDKISKTIKRLLSISHIL